MKKQPILKNGNSVIWLVLAVVIVLIVIGGFYWLMNKPMGKATSMAPTYTTPVTGGNVTFDDFQKEVQAEDISKNPASVEEDFTALDKDLQGL